MTGLRKIFFVAGAAAALAITAVIQTPFAQDSDPAKSLMGPRAESGPATPAANKNANAAMTVEPNSAPMTDADKRAAAAMEMGSGLPMTDADKKAAAAMGMDSSPALTK